MKSPLLYASAKGNDLFGSIKVAFGGHFSPLATDYPTALYTFSLAFQDMAKNGGQLAVLVNDIAPAAMISEYIKNGREGIGDFYTDRADCNRGRCSISSQANNTLKHIDWPRLESIKDRLEEQGFDLAQPLEQQSIQVEEKPITYHQFIALLVREIMDETIKRMVKDSGFKSDLPILVFTEHSLRNVAAKRHNEKANTGFALGDLFQHETTKDLYGNFYEARNKMRMPRCGAIMFCLFERLANGGVIDAVHYYSETDGAPVKSAVTALTFLARSFPDWKVPKFGQNNVHYVTTRDASAVPAPKPL